jgi:hypothetical protein
VRRTTAAQKATAYHEAGHAFMAWFLRVGLKKVTIVPREGSAGRCHHEKLLRGKHPEVDDSNPARLRKEKLIMVALAGPIAQQLYNPRSYRRHHAMRDHQTAAEVVENLSRSSEEANAYIEWLQIRTKDRLREPANWGAVQALANELLRRSTLEGREVKPVILRGVNAAYHAWNRRIARQRKGK